MHAKIRIRTLAVLLALLVPALTATASDPPLPDWDRLSEAQRALLVAPIRERWNAEPEARARMLRHAQRWQQLTPEQRRHAHRGMKRWSHLSPEQRDRARVIFARIQDLPEAERRQWRENWRRMTPEQRKAWLEQARLARPQAPPPGDTP
jgi:hypothetical protein